MRTSYKLVRHIGVINRDAAVKKTVSLIQWSGMPVSLDIRKWRDGSPEKGISLYGDEVKELCQVLKTQYPEYFADLPSAGAAKNPPVQNQSAEKLNPRQAKILFWGRLSTITAVGTIVGIPLSGAVFYLLLHFGVAVPDFVFERIYVPGMILLIAATWFTGHMLHKYK